MWEELDDDITQIARPILKETSAKGSGTGTLPVNGCVFSKELDRLEACPTAFCRDL
jgi:hypothetical protein